MTGIIHTESIPGDFTERGSNIGIGTTRTLLGLICLCSFFMGVYGSHAVFTGNFDSGTVELMAANIARGEDFPLFWYGQHYFGALESYTAALMIKLFGFSELSMTLAPILFSELAILGNYLLFREIAGRKAGLVAAAAAAFSGYFSWYYGYAMTGGYPAILALGTWILWLGTRLYNREASFPSLALQIICIGVLSAVGLWVHFLIAPYLLATAVFLVAVLLRRKFSPAVLCCYLLGALIAACGLLPSWIAGSGNVESGMIAQFSITLKHFQQSLSVLATDFKQLLFWRFERDLSFDPAWLYVAAVVIFLFASCCAIIYLVRRTPRGRLFLLLAPVYYLIFFLLLFLPHHMAVIRAARYVIGPWIMLTSLMWAYAFLFMTSGVGKKLIAGLFLIWIAYVCTGDYLFVQVSAKDKQTHLRRENALLTLVKTKQLQAVQMIGTNLFGFKGQVLSMLTDNRIKFVHAGSERYEKNAQFAEDQDRYGLLSARWDKSIIKDSLSPLQVAYQTQGTDVFQLFYGFRFPQHSGQAIAGDTVRVTVSGNTTGQGNWLTDRRESTVVEWDKTASGQIILDLGRERLISGLWLTAPQGLKVEGLSNGWPSQYKVSASGDNVKFSDIITTGPRILPAYEEGHHLYLDGYFSRMECRFSPVRARFLKLDFPVERQVCLNEIVVFEPGADDRPHVTREKEVAQVTKLLARNNVDYTMTDRWLSARLIHLQQGNKRLPALPRYNLRATSSLLPSRLLIPRSGLALAPARAIADECQERIVRVYGATAIRKRVDLERYSLLFLQDVASIATQGPFLYWNGHLLLELPSYQELQSINIRGTGLPVIFPKDVSAKGFYHDFWTNGHGILKHLRLPVTESLHYLVVMSTGYSPFADDMEKLRLRVKVNGESLEFDHAEKKSYIFRLKPGMPLIRKIEILSSTFVPPTSDKRSLGLDVVCIFLKV